MPEQALRVGFQPQAGTELDRLGQALLTAALAYRKALSMQAAATAVVWVEYPTGELVIVTRGEYREQLMENIEPLAVMSGDSDEQAGRLIPNAHVDEWIRRDQKIKAMADCASDRKLSEAIATAIHAEFPQPKQHLIAGIVLAILATLRSTGDSDE